MTFKINILHYFHFWSKNSLRLLPDLRSMMLQIKLCLNSNCFVKRVYLFEEKNLTILTSLLIPVAFSAYHKIFIWRHYEAFLCVRIETFYKIVGMNIEQKLQTLHNVVLVKGLYSLYFSFLNLIYIS